MLITLLTHPRETLRKTNTGKLAYAITNVNKVIWHRRQPNMAFLNNINQLHTALLFPASCSEMCNKITPKEHYEHVIIVDSTWQEARKIINQSPYLLKLPRCALSTNAPSVFTLRRNQKAEGLCTAECIIELFKRAGKQQEANQLKSDLDTFIEEYGKTPKKQNNTQ